MTKQNYSRTRARAIAAFAALLGGLSLPATQANAANGTWLSGTAGGNWSVTTNWTDGIVAGGDGAIATFTATNSSGKTLVLDTNATVGSLAFGGAGWTLSSNPGYTLTLASGTSAAPTISGAGTISAILAGSQGFTKSTSGNLYLTGANTYAGVTTLTNGQLYVSHASALGLSGAGNGTVVSQASGQYPQLQFSNNVTTSEDITLSMNWYNVSNNGSVVGGNLLYSGNSNTTLQGTLTLNRAAGSNANVVHLIGMQTGAGTLAVTGAVSGSATGGQASGTYADPTRLQLRTTVSDANLNISGVISDGTLTTGGLSVYTQDNSAGIVRLSAANTYTGSTVHQKGTLLINNTTGSGTGFGAVKVSSTAVFGGTGISAPTGANGVSFASGAIVAPGNLTDTGALVAAGQKLSFDLSNTTGNVTFQSGSVIRLDINVAGTALVDNLAFLGLTAGAGDVVFNDNVVNFSLTGAALADGLYTLVSFSAENAYLGNLVLGTGLEGYTATLLHNANSIQLQIGNAIPEPGSFAALAGAAALAFGAMRRRRR